MKAIWEFLHENHLLALLLGTGVGASLTKMKKKIEKIFIKNKGNIFKTVEEVTEKITTALDEEEAPEEDENKKVLETKDQIQN